MRAFSFFSARLVLTPFSTSSSQVVTGKTSGVTIVVSPLLSLINDQVSHLKKLGIYAIGFTGDLPQETKKAALLALSGGPNGTTSLDGRVVYVTPEMLNKSPAFAGVLRSIYRKGKLARFVIDEAHCVSSVSRARMFIFFAGSS